MTLLIGMDEAGYGPNLGPLIVCATCWQVCDDAPPDLWTSLSRAVRKVGHNASPTTTAARAPKQPSHMALPDERLIVDDSKRVYTGKRGPRDLETTVLAFAQEQDSEAIPLPVIRTCSSTFVTQPRGATSALTLSPLGAKGCGRKASHGKRGVISQPPQRLSGLCRLLGAMPSEAERRQPWWTEHDPPLPHFSDAALLEEKRRRLQAHLNEAGVKLLQIQSRMVCPEQFNALLRREGSKGALLSRVAIDLLRKASEHLPAGPVVAVADKHGGRNYYRGLLQDAFDEHFVFCVSEGRRQSRYRVERDGGILHVCFQQSADADHLAVALASMVSKYLRELCMEQFNRFWTRRIEGLKPTAGYPADAPRFWSAIRPLSEQMGIPESAIWRER